jgi:hypothetical protein
MVTAPAPQLNVIAPPAVAAARSASNVQLAAVPIPTTVGLEVSAAWARAGTPALHDPLGLPAPPVEDGPPPLPPPPAGDCDELLEPHPNQTSATGTTRTDGMRMRTSRYLIVRQFRTKLNLVPA